MDKAVAISAIAAGLIVGGCGGGLVATLRGREGWLSVALIEYALAGIGLILLYLN